MDSKLSGDIFIHINTMAEIKAIIRKDWKQHSEILFLYVID